MTYFALVYIVIVSAIAGLAAYALADGWRRALVTVIFVAVAVTVYCWGIYASGTPRPFTFARYFGVEDTMLVAYIPVEDEAIYVWLWSGDGTPTAWVLPWDDETARAIHEAGQQAGEEGGGGVVVEGRPFAEGEFVPHPAPVTNQESK